MVACYHGRGAKKTPQKGKFQLSFFRYKMRPVQMFHILHPLLMSPRSIGFWTSMKALSYWSKYLRRRHLAAKTSRRIDDPPVSQLILRCDRPCIPFRLRQTSGMAPSC